MRGRKSSSVSQFFFFFFFKYNKHFSGVNFTLLTRKSTFSSFHVIVALLIIFSVDIYFTMKTFSMMVKEKMIL